VTLPTENQQTVEAALDELAIMASRPDLIYVSDLEPARAALRDLVAQADDAIATLRRIQEWDCLNPADPGLCADHPWLKRLVDDALARLDGAR